MERCKYADDTHSRHIGGEAVVVSTSIFHAKGLAGFKTRCNGPNVSHVWSIQMSTVHARASAVNHMTCHITSAIHHSGNAYFGHGPVRYLHRMFGVRTRLSSLGTVYHVNVAD